MKKMNYDAQLSQTVKEMDIIQQQITANENKLKNSKLNRYEVLNEIKANEQLLMNKKFTFDKLSQEK